jgi:hypothetical protein
MRNGLSEVNVRYVIYGPIIILANVNIEANKICTIKNQLTYFDNMILLEKNLLFSFIENV